MELKSGDLFFYRTFSWEVKKNREMIREDESAKRSKW